MTNLMEELVPIPAASAIATAKALAAKEGLLTGISGGGTMWAALETAKKVRTLIHLPTCSLLHQLLLLKPAPIHYSNINLVDPVSGYVLCVQRSFVLQSAHDFDSNTASPLALPTGTSRTAQRCG